MKMHEVQFAPKKVRNSKSKQVFSKKCSVLLFLLE